LAVDASFLPIINRALSQLGRSVITSAQLTTPDNKQSRLVDREFTAHLDALVEDHPWKLFIHRTTLSENVVAPEWGFEHAYDLPNGTVPASYPYCVRLLEINDTIVWGWNLYTGWTVGSHQYLRWRVEERQILIDIADTLDIRYIGRPADASNFTGQFREILALYLAVAWAESLTAAEGLSDRLERRLNVMLQEARTIDSMNDREEPFRTTSWLAERIT